MITQEELSHLARLAKLLIPEQEKEKLAKEMSEIVAFAAEVQQASAIERERLRPATGELREDAVQPSFAQEEILRNAGGGQDGLFLISGKR